VPQLPDQARQPSALIRTLERVFLHVDPLNQELDNLCVGTNVGSAARDRSKTIVFSNDY
jgi:hypothetical protein